MRHFGITVLALVLVAGTAWAQTPPATGQAFGGITCRQKVPCPESSDSSPDALAANANSCLLTGLGLTSTTGFFDDVFGLDSGNCLRIKAGIMTQDPKQIVPHCCVIALPDNTCTFHCDMLSQQH